MTPPGTTPGAVGRFSKSRILWTNPASGSASGVVDADVDFIVLSVVYNGEAPFSGPMRACWWWCILTTAGEIGWVFEAPGAAPPVLVHEPEQYHP